MPAEPVPPTVGAEERGVLALEAVEGGAPGGVDAGGGVWKGGGAGGRGVGRGRRSSKRRLTTSPRSAASLGGERVAGEDVPEPLRPPYDPPPLLRGGKCTPSLSPRS